MPDPAADLATRAQESSTGPLTEESPAATETTLLGPEAPLSPEPEPALAPDAALLGREGARMRMVGIGMAVLGTGLVAAPHVSAAAARALAPLAVPEVVGGIWIAGGLLLFVGGLLRRSLAGIRHSLETVGAETARLAELARETHVLGSSVELVQQANQELKLGVVGVQKQIERLTEIASDPNNTVSMFRLAASVDQLGAKLDIFIKDQFKVMRQQLTDVVERTNQSGAEVCTRIGQLGEQLSEEHVSQQLAFTEQNARTYAGIERIVAGSDANIEVALRIEAQVAAEHQAQSNALESLGADWLQGSDALNTGIRDLGGRIDRRLVEQAGALDGRLGQIDGALESISVDWLHGAETLNNGIQELGGRIERRIEEQTGSVEERLGELDGRIQEQTSSVGGHLSQIEGQLQEQASSVGGKLGKIDSHLHEQASSVDGRLKRIDGALESLSLESLQNAETVQNGLQDLGGRIERRIEEQSGSVGGRIEKLDGHLQEQVSSVGGRIERLDSALEHSGKERDDLARDLAARLERELALQSRGVHQSLEALAEVAQRVEQVGSELNAMLAKLGTSTTGEHEELRAALTEGLELVHAVSTQTGVAAEESLKAAARLEASLHDSRECSRQELSSIHEAWSEDAAARISWTVEFAARLEQELAEHSARLTQLAEALTDLAGASNRPVERQGEVSRLLASPRELSFGPPEPPELAHDWTPSSEQQELLEARDTLEPARELVLEPPPALPTSNVESRSDVTP